MKEIQLRLNKIESSKEVQHQNHQTYGSNYGTKNSSNFIQDTKDTRAQDFNFENY